MSTPTRRRKAGILATAALLGAIGAGVACESVPSATFATPVASGGEVGPPPPSSSAEPPGGPCVTSIDCGGDLVCGYDPTAGCAALGQCVEQEPGPAGPPACGCDGLPVQYVALGWTNAPAASPLSCGAEAGVDAAGGPNDAGGPDDAGGDGGAAGDAGGDATGNEDAGDAGAGAEDGGDAAEEDDGDTGAG